MANTYTLAETAPSAHKTLDGTNADAATVPAADGATVIHTGSSGLIYARADGTTAVAAADGTHVIQPGGWYTFLANDIRGTGPVSIIATSAVPYSIELEF